MPIHIYIAPFHWYEKSKQDNSFYYRQMILESLQAWTDASGQLIRFKIVNRLSDSQIDFKWRRVDRKSLGHCQYHLNAQGTLYSAEIQIGISDGILHQEYNNTLEVRHTILHEIGHALGLIGHSDEPEDIMYVPHQYGTVGLSERDTHTLQWLYRLPIGFDFYRAGLEHKLEPPFTVQDVLDCLSGNPPAPKTKPASQNKLPQAGGGEILLGQHDILSQMGRFYLSTQNIQLPPALKKSFLKAPPPESHPES